MNKNNIDHRVMAHPEFQAMAREKSILGWSLTVIMIIVYTVYILYIGASPATFAQTVGDSAVTVGIYAGLFVIFFAIAITGIYVYRANGVYEAITQKVVHEVHQEADHD
ncbi:MAG: DUF485 domain-containing protein [Neisseriaceae bacterium]|nr:DUF485 domain-containing protein [Neisseriaceae bacterium]MBP6862663.1 DUF485 domain-containing protein [Neisseriaceae bacterium]